VSTYFSPEARKYKVIKTQSDPFSVEIQVETPANDELTVDRPFSLTCFDQ
jgi:hypothetical protein